ncbi:NAD/NADP octopine/nopaline dehydrogenase family protein [Enterocloster citroniae]
MKVTIIGGGNIGMCLAGEISRIKGYDVTLFASNPKLFNKKIQVVDDEKNLIYYSGVIDTTDNLTEAITDADIILCTYPSQLRKNLISLIEDCVKETAFLGFFPGYGGAEMYCDKLIEKGVTIFALQKVPYVARTKERGKVAGLMSKKNKLLVAALPHKNTNIIIDILEDMLQIKCICLKNYMAATLLPGNPLLHTSGSFIYLKDYQSGQVFPEQIYYYQSWNDECSEFICTLSDEMMEICRKLPIDLSEVESIQTYYESPTPKDLTRKFHSIPSYKKLVLPMIDTGAGFIPDFTSRFYTEDIPFGICILKALGQLVDVETPMMNHILEWFYRMTSKEYFKLDGHYGKDIHETAIPQLFGFDSTEKLSNFYLR